MILEFLNSYMAKPFFWKLAKCFFHSAPLFSHFFSYHFLDLVVRHNCFNDHRRSPSFFIEILILRVSQRVVSKVKTFTLLYGRAHPARKICVVHLNWTLILFGFIAHQLSEIIEIDLLHRLIKISNDVLGPYITVLIDV